MFDVMLGGELKDLCRRRHPRHGRLQDRISARFPEGQCGLVVAKPIQVLAVRHLSLTVIQPGPKRLMLGSQVTDFSGSCGKVTIWG